MNGSRNKSIFLAAVAAISATTASVRDASAVILVDREQRNVTAPTGSLLSAWNLQGTYNGFNVTPISPHQFVSAHHLGSGAGGTILYGTGSYVVSTFSDIAGTDLRIYTTTSTIPTYAALWDASVDGSEIGKPMAVFGRGSQRGAAIVAPIDPGPVASPVSPTLPMVLTAAAPMNTPTPVPPNPGTVRGWSWGALDGLQSWGKNVVDDVVVDDDLGELLAFGFSAGAAKVADEGGLSGGDSGGGVFIFSGGQWKLAAVNLGIDGPFNYTPGGAYFNGNVFDARGLYYGSPSDNALVPYVDGPVEGDSYSTRIGGANLAAIRSVIGGTSSIGGGPTFVPEPSTLILIAGVAALRSRRRS